MDEKGNVYGLSMFVVVRNVKLMWGVFNWDGIMGLII